MRKVSNTDKLTTHPEMLFEIPRLSRVLDVLICETATWDGQLAAVKSMLIQRMRRGNPK
jgi:hypothetical protein